MILDRILFLEPKSIKKNYWKTIFLHREFIQMSFTHPRIVLTLRAEKIMTEQTKKSVKACPDILKSTIAISCFYTMMELLLGERLIICAYKWKNPLTLKTPGDRRHWICSSESLCRDSKQSLFYSSPLSCSSVQVTALGDGGLQHSAWLLSQHRCGCVLVPSQQASTQARVRRHGPSTSQP